MNLTAKPTLKHWSKRNPQVNLDEPDQRQSARDQLTSPVLDLEILLEVNLNFQVRLTIILACGIFPERTAREVQC